MTGRRWLAALGACLVVGCSGAARLEIVVGEQPANVTRLEVEVRGDGPAARKRVDAPPHGTGLRVALAVEPGERVVTVRSLDARGDVVLEGSRLAWASPGVVSVCAVRLRGPLLSKTPPAP
jgi:hypothetical protein